MLSDGTVLDESDTPILICLDDRLDAVERAWFGDPPVELSPEKFPVRMELAASQQRWLRQAPSEPLSESQRYFFGSWRLASEELQRDWLAKVSTVLASPDYRWWASK